MLRLDCMRHPKRSKANEMAHEVEKSTAAVQSAARHEDAVHEVGLCAVQPRKGARFVNKVLVGCCALVKSCWVKLSMAAADHSWA